MGGILPLATRRAALERSKSWRQRGRVLKTFWERFGPNRRRAATLTRAKVAATIEGTRAMDTGFRHWSFPNPMSCLRSRCRTSICPAVEHCLDEHFHGARQVVGEDVVVGVVLVLPGRSEIPSRHQHDQAKHAMVVIVESPDHRVRKNLVPKVTEITAVEELPESRGVGVILGDGFGRREKIPVRTFLAAGRRVQQHCVPAGSSHQRHTVWEVGKQGLV
jgi:hypothetical protein